jgi:hypothetical protein
MVCRADVPKDQLPCSAVSYQGVTAAARENEPTWRTGNQQDEKRTGADPPP